MADEVPGMAPSALSVPSDCLRSRKVRLPCGECHLQPGEVCDICGARDGSRTG